MMHYVIDGYNLLFRNMGWNENLQEQRQALVEHLNEKIGAIGWHVTLVFDAYSQYGAATRSRHDALDIVFSGEGVSADDHIISELEHSRTAKQTTVVTSDKLLAWQARNHGASTESVDAFMHRLNKRYNKKPVRPVPQAPRVQIPVEPRKLPKQPKPRPSDSPAQCYLYYLQVFEANSGEEDH